MFNPQAKLTRIRPSNDGIKHSDITYYTPSIYTSRINIDFFFSLRRIGLSLRGNLLTYEATLDIDILLLTKQVIHVLNVNYKPYFHDFDAFTDVKENQSFNITLEASVYPIPITHTCEYYINIRANNSYHLSDLTNEIKILTSRYLPTLLFYSFTNSVRTTRFSLTVIVIVALISLFIMKCRRSNITNDKLSKAGTNETKANTLDIFRTISLNLFFDRLYSSIINAYRFNRYQKYEEDDIKQPSVSSYSSVTLTRLTPNQSRL
ncbi:unnamed protein product [Rotaria sordida]|uniref:Uncharacterized protein n=1 Tax=Rotaria sordida TaxID=392033 RepID=A0A815JCY5_9BILA|nr:unnamed protein product [Rotaria sordida]CAF1615307.1 unnamed protein product [Rotaria sordida]